ncbi:MAG: S1 RNA-binding domain-containing protein [Deltaproteobacteria bacterium]|nr:S1 RNA-binding domain-containing protein [Deltaproteobacteria bacterium]
MVKSQDNNKDKNQDHMDFAELFEDSMKSMREGSIVKGEVLHINEDFVLVDIGYKSEGQIRITEFIDSKGQLSVKPGDTVEVLLVSKENKEGRIILSREKVAKVTVWNDVETAYKNNDTIRGRIISQVKGGLSVDIGIQAFLPASQADIRPIRNLGELIGREYDFKILKFEKRDRNIVLSRKAAMETEQKALREKTLGMLREGSELVGIVSNIKNYGLFVDLGGIVGLVHISDISWGKTIIPIGKYQTGDSIRVKVLKFDKEKEKLSLGIKQLTPDPWSLALEKYPTGTEIMGKVLGIKDYGAFVELEEGIEGLIHISEMSLTQKIEHPSQVLSIGDTINAVVINIDVPQKRISLSMKKINNIEGLSDQ